MDFMIKLCNNFNTIEFEMNTDTLDFDKIKEINDKFIAATSNASTSQVVKTNASNSVKMASEKQMKVIHQFKLSDKESMTFEEANELIKKSIEKKGE